MNQGYAVVLYDYISEKDRNDILRNRVKETIRGFRTLDAAPPTILKNNLKNNAKFCGKFLYAVARKYDCSIKKYEKQDELPKMTKQNFLGLFAWKCYNLDTSSESSRKLKNMLEWYEQALAERDDDLDEDTEIIQQSYDETDDAEMQGDIDNPEDQLQNLSSEEDIMPEYTQYIGYIKETSGFYNFWPACIIHDSSVESKTRHEMGDIFPDYGNLLLYSEQRDYVRRNYRSGEIYVITISPDNDLMDNDRPDTHRKTQYKIDVKQMELQGKIKRLKDFKIYPVLRPINAIDFSKKTVLVKEEVEDIDVNDSCVIEEDGVLYGPFKAKENDAGKCEVILPNNCIVKCYRPAHGGINYIEIQAVIQGENYYTNSVCLNDEFVSDEIDKISDEDLFESFQALVHKRDIKDMKVEDYVSSAFHDIPESIKQQRTRRIKEFFEIQHELDDVQKSIANFMADLFYKYGETEYFSALLNRILDNNELATKIQSFSIVQERLTKMQNEYEEMKLHREEEEARIKAAAADEERRISEIAQKTSAEIRSLTTQKETLCQEISVFEKERNGHKKIADLEAEQRDLETTNNYLRKRVEETEKALREKLESIAVNSVDAAFDGRIADEVFKAAAKWNRDQQHQNFEEVANQLIAEDKTETLVGEELVNYLCNAVNRYRKDYSRNDILNIFICLSQNFLTVFSGEPGTGKTSICNIIAHILGTGKISKTISNDYNINVSRYIPISVERGWTSKRDFIGYYNPLSQTFEKANKHLYDGLRLLDAESKQSQYPLIILLDEANLSPMEYYWADFMNICDSDSPLNKITLGDEMQLQIPITLRFTATINNDDTTERFSPRLLDRASLIRLPDVEYALVEDENLKDESFVKIISWAALQETFCNAADEEFDSTSSEIYKEIFNQFKKMRISISHRVYKAIKNYWLTAKDLFENVEGSDPTIIALDYAVAQRLLPKVNGGGDSYRDSLNRLREICEKRNLTKCKRILQDIIERGESSMNYYQYF